ncbi:MAG: hypothetical protein ACOYK9_00805 [Chlamydiia bacterium]
MLDASYLTKFDWDQNLLQEKVLYLNLGLFKNGFNFDDQIRFQVMGNVLDTLCQKAPNCEEIVLYTGRLNWSHECPFSIHLEKKFEEWLLDLYGEVEKSEQKRAVFQTNVLMEYLHRLASFAPDTIRFRVAFTDFADFAPAHLAQLLSKNRFTHFEIDQEPYEGTVGFILAKDEKVDADTYRHMETILEEHNRKVRFLPEEMIPELWTGLERLYAEKGKLTRFGLRGIAGFEAAEGEVVYLEDLVKRS